MKMYAELQRTKSAEVRIKSLTITKLKTSLIQQVAEQRGMTLCKLNLSQLEEVGDMVGYPQKEVLLQWKASDGQIKSRWWPESLLNKVPENVKVTSTTRMSYAPPAWLPTKDNPNGTILMLDDYSRANQLFMQASLPKNTSVVLEK